MNLLHMKYALEVARLGSLSKAAETLHTAQPNISRSIKELEGDLGITVFTRTQKGMVLTPEGEEFLGYAKAILRQMDEVEAIYRGGGQRKRRFSVSVPRAGYISDGMADFSRMVPEGPMELFYRETGTRETLGAVTDGDADLGIIRYPADADRYVKTMLEEKGLAYELVAEFQHLLLMSRDHPLAGKDVIAWTELLPYTEIVHADPTLPTLPLGKPGKPGKDDRTETVPRRIFVFERAGQFDLLSENPSTFLWTSPLSRAVQDRFGLTLRPCSDNDCTYKDVLIRREDHRLTGEDKRFITALCEAKRRHFSV